MRLGWNAPASVCSSLVLLVGAVMVVIACGGEPAPALPTATVIPPAQAVAPSPAPTYTPLPTYTPYPTYTRVPTATPDPTATPEPAATPVPTPTLTPADSDRAALNTLYESTNGSGWTNSTNWVSDAPVEQWHGVTVDANGRVVELSLQRNGLQGELPAQLGELSELRNLRLWSNDLSGTIPSELSQLTQLEQFAVGGNRLHGTIPDWLSGLHNLSNLHLTTNRFTGPLPAWLGDLPLRRLILGKNRFEGDIPEELGNLRGLSALWLGGNNLTGCIPDSLRGVPDNDFAESGVPFCADDSLASAREVTPTPQPTATPSPTATASTVTPETALTTRPEPPEVWYFDDPEVPYLKWEVGPEVSEAQYEAFREGIILMHEYAGSVDMADVKHEVVLYLFQDPEEALAAYARLKGFSVDTAQEVIERYQIQGEAGHDFIYLNLSKEPGHVLPAVWHMTFSAHELVHVHQRSATSFKTFDEDHDKVRPTGPAWFTEGEATWKAARALSSAGHVSYSSERSTFKRRALVVDTELSELATYSQLRPIAGGYELGAMAVELLVSRSSVHALTTYRRALGPSTSWQEEFESAFGMTIDEFYTLFEEHRADGFPELDLPNIAPRVPLAEVDREALTALYRSTNGGNWSNNDNWLSDEPGNRWHGVTTDPDGHVTVLDLRDNRLNGEIPPALGDLVNLRELRLRENQLRGAIPPELGKLANLEVLSLVHNRLDGPIPPELGDLTGLKELHIWGNELSGGIPATLANMTGLTVFSVGVNELTGEVPAWLGDLTNLQSIHLSENRLTGSIPDNLSNLTRVRYFNINRNLLSGEIPSWLGDFPLRRLYLSDNQFTGEIPEEFSGLSNLEWLWLGGNELTGCLPAGLSSVAEHDLGRLGLPDC